MYLLTLHFVGLNGFIEEESENAIRESADLFVWLSQIHRRVCKKVPRTTCKVTIECQKGEKVLGISYVRIGKKKKIDL